MRILAAIPHFYAVGDAHSPDGNWHGSVGEALASRIAAVTSCIAALHQTYGPAQHMIDHGQRVARPANQRSAAMVDVVLCTTGPHHLIGRLPLPEGSFAHRSCDCPGPQLGFECHAVLRERLGDYDYYAYLEDDLIARDPWMFLKLNWFNAQLGDDVLLQPNRYEVGPLGLVNKVYVDGDLAVEVTAPFQDLSVMPVVTAEVFGTTFTFHRAKNPHAGCFFLNARQMAAWVSRADFLDRDTSFIGPLESAATLGIMRTFRVYKTAPDCAGFLEIQHHGTSYLCQLQPR